MKTHFKGITKTLTPDSVSAVKEFVKFLQTQLSLRDDVYLNFLSKRDVPMTTGVRMPNNEIFILTTGRLLIDVIRTIGHEWVHEYQHQKMGLKDDEKIQDIGGPEENMANVLSGIFVKKFEKEFPKYSKILYDENK
jgi:hypothetical protein